MGGSAKLYLAGDRAFSGWPDRAAPLAGCVVWSGGVVWALPSARMGIAFQLYSIEPAMLDELIDTAAVDEFVMANYCKDVVEDRFEALWLDKSGMGILETYGMITESLVPPQLWMLGTDQALPSDDDMAPPSLVTTDQVDAIAAWIATESDADFAARAAGNMVDTEVEYLAHYFAILRDFYIRAAAAGRAVVVYVSL